MPLTTLKLIAGWLEKGEFVDLSLLWWSFSHLDQVLVIWIRMFAASFAVIPFIQAIDAWNISERIWIPLYLAYQTLFFIWPSVAVLRGSFPPPSAAIVMCEQTRMWMKMHAYVREKILYGKYGSSKYATFIPEWARKLGVTLQHVQRPHITIEDTNTEIGRYLYFHFAPTLIYRDHYPRYGEKVHWMRALAHFANLCLVVVFMFLLLETFCIPEFRESASHPGNLSTFVRSTFRSMLPSTIIFVLMFFGLLHTWFNMWAEILCFGDRRFYEDWWNVTNWGAYYRKWNAVVHEWLRHYVYFDSVRLSLGKLSKAHATALVFGISAIVHEHVIACSLGFFYPILLLMFGGPGVFFIQLTRKNHPVNNVFMWTMLSAGTALLMVLYTNEYYARHGGAPWAPAPILKGDEFGLITPLVPRSWVAMVTHSEC